MSEKRDPLLVTAGEFFLDLIFFDLPELPRLGEELKSDNFELAFGGGAAITAVAAGRLGSPTRLLTAFGDTALDVQARQELLRFGVDPALCDVYPNLTSGLTVAVSTRQDRYFLTCPGANRYVEEMVLSSDHRERLRQASHVHLALTPTHWAPFSDLVEDLGRHGVTTSWDLGWEPNAAKDPGFQRLWEQISVLFLNEMEALRYTNSEHVEEAAREAARPGNTVVVKLGSEGALAFRQGEGIVRQSPPPVEALDTTGAGDAFNGGFLSFFIDGRSLQSCLRAGNITGALSTRGPGGVGTLPDLTEFQSTWDNLSPHSTEAS